MGHPRFVCVPAATALTDEAAENGVQSAAAQLAAFLETGSVRHSLNFPSASLPRLAHDHTRLCIVNENRPGMLGAITSLLGARDVNIAQQLNASRDAVAYNVIDLAMTSPEAAQTVTAALHGLDGVLSTRLIYTGAALEGPSHFYVRDNTAAGLVAQALMGDM